MVMKLLNPSQANATLQKSAERDSKRAIELQDLIVGKYKELGSIEVLFEETLARQKAAWAEEEQEYKNAIDVLLREVRVLEKRRKDALIPLTTRAEELENIAKLLTVREAKAIEDRKEVEELKDLLQQRLDEVGERDLRLNELSATLARREVGIASQEQDIRTNSERLTKAIQDATLEIAAAEQILATEKLKVETERDHIKQREQEVDIKEAGFDARERAIQDRYETLQRAIAEAAKKYNL